MPMPIEYICNIRFNLDGIAVVLTGEGIKITELESGAMLRHRHIRLINKIADLLREYAQSNKTSTAESLEIKP